MVACAVTLSALPLARVVSPPGHVQLHAAGGSSPWEALRHAMGDRSYLLLHAGFFACGFHIAFLVTHLPGEVNLCGLPPTVASWSLALIGLANIVGSLLAGSSTARAAPALPTHFKPLNLAGLKVLIVDDEPDARDLIERVMNECDAEVIVAASAEAALSMIERLHPHVLVSDIGMPDLDGHELLRRVRALGEAKGGKLPAIALTAFARSEDRTRALRAGFNAHLSKPVEPSELVVTVASLAGRTSDPE